MAASRAAVGNALGEPGERASAKVAPALERKSAAIAAAAMNFCAGTVHEPRENVSLSAACCGGHHDVRGREAGSVAIDDGRYGRDVGSAEPVLPRLDEEIVNAAQDRRFETTRARRFKRVRKVLFYKFDREKR